MKLRIYFASTHAHFPGQNLGFRDIARLILTVSLLFPASFGIAIAQTVHIPDPALRTALEVALEKKAGENITQADMASLESLEAVESGVRDLTGLEFATNLTDLHLGLNAISDVSPLKNLTNLTFLDLHRNRNISDVSPLKGLTTLTWLSLRGNRISDMSPLTHLTELTYLHIGYNRISKVSSLETLTKLTFLNLDANRIVDVSPLENLTTLVNLALDDNRIVDVSPLENLTTLKFLNLNDNRIADTSPLKGLTNLTFIDLHGNAISDVSTLSALTKLTNLKLHSNQISNVSVLSSLTKLTKLDLHNNKISDVSPLQDMTKLMELDLHDNEISDISPLKNLVNLTVLDLSGNHILDFSPIAGLIENLVKYDNGNQAVLPSEAADVNRDGVVDRTDLVLVAICYRNPNFADFVNLGIYPDVNNDGTVDVTDIIAVAAQLVVETAAPEFRRRPPGTYNLTPKDLAQWIHLAKQRDTQTLETRKGIAVLEYLLLTFTSTELRPKNTALLANYPNPFNPETWIPYQLATPTAVRISIHSADGKFVRILDLGALPAGMYHSRSRAAYWDGRNELGESVASGVYFYTLTAGDFSATGKMLIRK